MKRLFVFFLLACLLCGCDRAAPVPSESSPQLAETNPASVTSPTDAPAETTEAVTQPPVETSAATEAPTEETTKQNEEQTYNFAGDGMQAQIELDAETDVPADAAVVLEASTGRVLYAQNADVPLPMASTTKIMTALLALENCQQQFQNLT